MREALLELNDLRLNFSVENLLFLKITLAVIMLGVALEIKIDHFKKVFLKPKGVIVGFLSQILILPLITCALALALNRVLTPAIAMGMILVAACPGGNISNFLTNLAKGNTALSVSLTAISTITAIVITPFTFALWGGIYLRLSHLLDASTLLRPLEISPRYMFEEVFVLLFIPICIGIFINWKFPKFTQRITAWVKKVSIVIFIGIVILMFAKNFDFFLDHIQYIFLLVLIQNALALGSGYLWATAWRLNEFSRRSITIETGIHNTGLALVLLFNTNIFPADLAVGGMAFIAAWWGIWHIVSGLVLALIWSKIPLKQSW